MEKQHPFRHHDPDSLIILKGQLSDGDNLLGLFNDLFY
jgi:hypothetical protein